MNYSDNGLALTKSFEGCRLTAYQDNGGIWTIGYGKTDGVMQGMTCTQEEADSWLANDIRWAAAHVNQFIKVPITQNQFDAIVDLAYNLGVTAIGNSTLVHKFNSGDIDGAAAEFLRWDKDDSMVVQGLLNRRIAEKTLFERQS